MERVENPVTEQETEQQHITLTLNSPDDIRYFLTLFDSGYRNFTLIINYDLVGSYDSPFYSLTEDLTSVDFELKT